MKTIISGVVLSCGLCACSPSLGKDIPVTRFPSDKNFIAYQGALGPLLVRPFTDARATTNVVEIDGRKITASNDVANAVRGAVETYMRAAGFSLGQSDAPSVGGEVREWSATVYPGFPSSRVESSAGVVLEVFGADGKERFRGTYRGDFSTEHPFLNENKVADALGHAMAAAIQEATRDTRFTSQITARR